VIISSTSDTAGGSRNAIGARICDQQWARTTVTNAPTKYAIESEGGSAPDQGQADTHQETNRGRRFQDSE
jgi:hypothetical protein